MAETGESENVHDGDRLNPPHLAPAPVDGEVVEQDDGLSQRQHEALLALLREPTVAKASESTGIPQRTLYNWLQDEKFMSALRKARRDGFSTAVAMTVRYAPVAVTALVKVVTDQKTPAAARVRAATALLDFGTALWNEDGPACGGGWNGLEIPRRVRWKGHAGGWWDEEQEAHPHPAQQTGSGDAEAHVSVHLVHGWADADLRLHR